MSKKAKSRLLKYGISGIICVAFAVVSLVRYDLGSLERLDLYRVLSDAFAIPGLLMIFSGCFVALSNEGALDGVAFVLSYAFNALIPGRQNKTRKYSDYVEERRGKKVKGYGFLFIVGGICMAVALVFLILFYCLHQT